MAGFLITVILCILMTSNRFVNTYVNYLSTQHCISWNCELSCSEDMDGIHTLKNDLISMISSFCHQVIAILRCDHFCQFPPTCTSKSPAFFFFLRFTCLKLSPCTYSHTVIALSHRKREACCHANVQNKMYQLRLGGEQVAVEVRGEASITVILLPNLGRRYLQQSLYGRKNRVKEGVRRED